VHNEHSYSSLTVARKKIMKNKKNMSVFIFKIIPTTFLSRIFGMITRIPLPGFILNPVIDSYCTAFNVKKDEILYPENGFRSFNHFFTRELKPGTHKIDTSEKAVNSPVDGRIDQYGTIANHTIIQAKGIDFSLKNLIPSKKADQFINGSFMTIYLSPGDYHRIHSPVSGRITGFFNIPGRLFTVQEYMVNGLKGLFTKNERIISYIENDAGSVAVCKIGAMNVGRISLSYADELTNRTFRRKKEVLFSEQEYKSISKGEELGIFNLGSTIILLFSKDMMKFDNFTIGHTIRMGDKIGSLI